MSHGPTAKAMGNGPMTSGPMDKRIVVRTISTLKDFHRCVELQREVWGEADLEIEPVTMFVVASHTGGQVLGAFDGETMVGYTLAVVGLRQNVVYLHSHQTGVLASHRDRGVGRQLKLFQRDQAIHRGIRLVEWTFDPLETKNAHFNLNRLGAICRRYIPDLYGITTSPLHRGLATDRLVAEWWLNSPRVIAAIANLAPEPAVAPAAIDLPRELEEWKEGNTPRVCEVQSRLRNEFTRWFQREYAAIAVRKNPDGSCAYLLQPWSDF